MRNNHRPMLGTNVVPPMFISSRLMAAYKIPLAGTLHIIADHYDEEMRLVYHTVIEPVKWCSSRRHDWVYDDRGDETMRPLRSAVNARVDYADTMRSLLSFLLADGERWAHVQAGHAIEDAGIYSFTARVAEWAWMFDTELQTAQHELECGLQCEPCVNEVANTSQVVAVHIHGGGERDRFNSWMEEATTPPDATAVPIDADAAASNPQDEEGWTVCGACGEYSSNVRSCRCEREAK
jgi:hypothetical protein